MIRVISNNHADRRFPTVGEIQPNFWKNGLIYMLLCMGVRRISSRGALVDLFKTFYKGGQKR